MKSLTTTFNHYFKATPYKNRISKITEAFSNTSLCKFGIAIACLSLLGSQIQAQNFEDEIEKEIKLLEKQKKLLELKRQNKQLQKELDSNTNGQKARKSPQSQPQSNTPYYPSSPSNQGNQNQNTNAPYYPSNPANAYDDNKTYQNAYKQSYNNAYQNPSDRKPSQTYFRLEGSYGIGYGEISPIADILNMSVKPSLWQGGFEFGTQNNDSSVRTVWLGVSYGEHNGKIVDNDFDLKLNGQYGTFYSGIDWIPTFGESPLRAVLGVYAAVLLVQYIDKGYIKSEEGQHTKFTWGVGAGFRVGLALDLGKHAQIEFGSRLGGNIGFGINNNVGIYMEKSTLPYIYYVNGYGAITFLF